MTTTVKITRKGQVTIPKKIREKLRTDFIYFEVKDDIVMIKPVRDAAGSLRDFAVNFKPGISMNKKRNKAWDEAVLEKNVQKG